MSQDLDLRFPYTAVARILHRLGLASVGTTESADDISSLPEFASIDTPSFNTRIRHHRIPNSILPGLVAVGR